MMRVALYVRLIAVRLQAFLGFLLRVGSLETQNATASIVVGLTFIANSIGQANLYTRYPDIYKYMEWAPSWTWGVVYIAAGVLHLLTMYTDVHWYRKHVVLAKAGLWLFLALCVLQAEPYAPAGWVFLIFAYSAAMVFLRIKLTKAGSPTHDSNAART